MLKKESEHGQKQPTDYKKEDLSLAASNGSQNLWEKKMDQRHIVNGYSIFLKDKKITDNSTKKL